MSETTLTVLLAEDNHQLREVYRRILERDYDVVAVEDGAAAVDALGDCVDLLVLDRRMPRMTGDEVLAHVHKAEYDVPVVMVTAVDSHHDISVDAYLEKPVRRTTLLDTVERLVGGEHAEADAPGISVN